MTHPRSGWSSVEGVHGRFEEPLSRPATLDHHPTNRRGCQPHTPPTLPIHTYVSTTFYPIFATVFLPP